MHITFLVTFIYDYLSKIVGIVFDKRKIQTSKAWKPTI